MNEENAYTAPPYHTLSSLHTSLFFLSFLLSRYVPDLCKQTPLQISLKQIITQPDLRPFAISRGGVLEGTKGFQSSQNMWVPLPKKK